MYLIAKPFYALTLPM